MSLHARYDKCHVANHKCSARITEETTAVAAERKSVQLGEEYPSPSAKVNDRKKRQKEDALAERIKKEL